MSKRYVELERIGAEKFRVASVSESAVMPKDPLIRPAPARFRDFELIDMVLDRGEWRLARKAEARKPREAEPAARPRSPIFEPQAKNANYPELLLSGIGHNRTGYAKLAREVLCRIGNQFRVRFNCLERNAPITLDEYAYGRTRAFESVKIAANAVHLRIAAPSLEPAGARKKIIFTMFESETMHPHFMGLLTSVYGECWVPTRWNKQVFRTAGARLPIHVMPLGVDPLVYRPMPKRELPECRLLTGPRAGKMERPTGKIFLSCGVTSFRKGFDVACRAFEQTFANDPEAALVLATTWHNIDVDKYVKPYARKSRVYQLTGNWSESDLAGIFASCDCYVACSLGEGWDLPLVEAAACGLPVIAGRYTGHLEYCTDENSFLFDSEDTRAHPDGGTVSPWYVGVQFHHLGDKSVAQLAALMKRVREDPDEAAKRAKILTGTIRRKYTWDRLAAQVAERLNAVCAE